MPPKKTVPVRSDLRAKAMLGFEPPPQIAADQHAVSEGRKPLAARRKDFAEIRAKATEMYGVPVAGLAAVPVIDAGFKFSAIDSDGEFNRLHVEALLGQAEELLASCEVAQSRHDELQLEKWKLSIELDRFRRLDQVGEQERAAGIDTLPYERAVLESGAEGRLEINHKSADAELTGLADELLATGFNKRMAARELAAWVTAFPQKDNDLRGDDATYVFDGASKTKADHLFDAARLEADEAAWAEIADLMARRFASIAASERGRLRKESLDLQAKWSNANIAFRCERSQVERDAFFEKLYQAQFPGSTFNWSEQIPPVQSHFAADFREAIARLAAARQGLKELYDYAPPFPQEGSTGYFNEVVAWTRNAKARVAQIEQLDQNYVLAMSVKELAKAGWESGRVASLWTFDVPQELFAGQRLVRLRGLSLAIEGEQEDASAKSKGAPPPAKPQGFWTASVSMPPVGTVLNLAGASNELDQKSLPRCFFGRVASREAGEPDVVGASALRNASPIGKQWRLTLASKSTNGFPTASIQDVVLYLHLAVRGTA